MSTGSKGRIVDPHRVKSSRRLFSGTPLEGESKQSPNATIRERRFETLFATAEVS